MDFSISEKHKQIRKSVTQFVLEELDIDAISSDRDETFPYDAWKHCARYGIQGLALPNKYGGPDDEVDFLSAMHAMERFGYACEDNGLAFGLNAQMWTVQMPILEFGNEEQKLKYLKPMGEGSIIGAHALTEREAGSDVYAMTLEAVADGDDFILNGNKELITFAPIADVFLIFAITNPKVGKWGISCFLVEKGIQGLTISSKKSKMGMRSIPIGSMEFQDVRVHKSALLGKPGLGFSILNHSLEYDRCCILASQLGAMERQLEENIKFVRTRKQSGNEIGKYQSVSNRIANMKLRLETSRLLLYKTAWKKSEGENVLLESAMLKLHLSEAFVDSSMDSIRNGGGRAFLMENGVERNLRDAIGGTLYAGTSDIQRNIIAKLLGL